MIILLLLIIGIPQVCFAQTRVLTAQHEGEEHKRKAEEFFESLHVVPSGMNWKVVNQHVRDARIERMRMQKGEQVQADSPSVGGFWREIGSVNQAGRVVAVDYDEPTSRLWVGGDGGTVWVGDTKGESWRILNETQRIPYPRILKNVRKPDGTERLIAVSNLPRKDSIGHCNIIFARILMEGVSNESNGSTWTYFK